MTNAKERRKIPKWWKTFDSPENAQTNAETAWARKNKTRENIRVYSSIYAEVVVAPKRWIGTLGREWGAERERERGHVW